MNKLDAAKATFATVPIGLPTRPRRWPIILGGGAILVAFVLGWQWLRPYALHGILLQSPQPANDFVLDTSAGKPFHLSDFRGKVVLLFFGYTTCPDVCPMTLVELARTRQRLGQQAEQVQVILVTVDPARDTPERLARYLAAFDPSFLGMTGTPAAIAAVATQFGVFFAHQQPDEGSLVDHTGTITVIDPAGYVRLLFSPNTSSADMAADLRYLIEQSSED
jgi:protein SCO1/2